MTALKYSTVFVIISIKLLAIITTYYLRIAVFTDTFLIFARLYLYTWLLLSLIFLLSVLNFHVHNPQGAY